MELTICFEGRGAPFFGNRRNRKSRLAVVVETPGGYIEIAQRIVKTFRRHTVTSRLSYQTDAMSAGTVLVLSGDAIYMDYYSILGPIDPQIERNGSRLPALGYLEQYRRLIRKSRAGRLTSTGGGLSPTKVKPADCISSSKPGIFP